MALRSFSTTDLHREIERREKTGKKLLKQREALAKELAELDKELAALGLRGRGIRRGAAKRSTDRRGPGRPAGRRRSTGRRRARNAMNLPDAIASAMEVRAIISPAEAATLVKKNGFKSTSKNFNMMVSNALSKDKRFKRVSRGQYERIK